MAKSRDYKPKRAKCGICKRFAIMVRDKDGNEELACCGWTPEESAKIGEDLEKTTGVRGFRPHRLRRLTRGV